jgi:glucose/arabinose dehydrogenase
LRGKNYGWPIVSNGSHYGSPEAPLAVVEIPDHTTTKKFEPPVRSWTPVISPSGAMFYTGRLFPGWENSMLVGGLSSMALIRLNLDEDKVAVEERIDMKRRIRDMEQARDGSLLVIVDDAKGELLRLSPAEGRGGVARKNPGARRTTPSNAQR